MVNPGRAGRAAHAEGERASRSRAGGVVELRTGGGGGFGEPLERDPERVRLDVLDGYVTRRGAEDGYGVILGDDLTIDAERTTALRATTSTQ